MRARYGGINIPESLLKEIDTFIASGKRGYTSRAEFVKDAVRRMLDEAKS
jgi:metal-responsive CopG/Arc/MetJ family transcriptional regulator